MNDLAKDSIRRFLKRLGIRILHEGSYKFGYNRENFLKAADCSAPIIFDVGANIGQSSVWFSKSFPTASIYAFEPVPSIYKRLAIEVANNKRIKPLSLACGKSSETLRIPVISNELVQSVQVLSKANTSEAGDKITVTTIDDYCAANNIRSIQILKTDTEGYDLDVLQGSQSMLRAGNVEYILSEATIYKGDTQHTNLFELLEFLKPFQFSLTSFFDVYHHKRDGKINYFNALFQKDA